MGLSSKVVVFYFVWPKFYSKVSHLQRYLFHFYPGLYPGKSLFRSRLWRFLSLLLPLLSLPSQEHIQILFRHPHLQQPSGIRLHKSLPSASPVFHTQFPPKPPEEALNDSNFGLQCSEHPHLSTDSASATTLIMGSSHWYAWPQR